MHHVQTSISILLILLIASGVGSVRVTIGKQLPHRLDEHFISYTLDTAQLEGRGYPYTDPYFIQLVKNLVDIKPSYLRIGGTSADGAFYAVPGSNYNGTVPKGYHRVINQSQFDTLFTFLRNTKLDLVFGINAGPGPRYENGEYTGKWHAENAVALLKYFADKDVRVAGLELSNEPSIFPQKWNISISPEQLAQDFATFKKVVRSMSTYGNTPIIGPDDCCSEKYLAEFIPAAKSTVDVFTFHFYPFDVCNKRQPPSPAELLDPKNLDKILNDWIKPINEVKDKVSDAPVWLGESASIACGGYNHISNAFAAAFQYLDQLGLLSQNGDTLEARQTLWGSNYGVIIEGTKPYLPSPDYWNGILWKRLMDRDVLATTSDDARVRAYATHNTTGNTVTLLVLNLSTESQVIDVSGIKSAVPRVEYHLTSTDLTSYDLYLNSKLLKVHSDGSLPEMEGRHVSSPAPLTLAPHSYAFVVFLSA